MRNLDDQGPVNVEIPQHGTYGAALFNPRWKKKRLEIIARDGNKCAFCGSTNALQVHHRQYHYSKSRQKFSEPWEYNDSHLLTVCEPCHKRGHQLYDIPVKQIK